MFEKGAIILILGCVAITRTWFIGRSRFRFPKNQTGSKWQEIGSDSDASSLIFIKIIVELHRGEAGEAGHLDAGNLSLISFIDLFWKAPAAYSQSLTLHTKFEQSPTYCYSICTARIIFSVISSKIWHTRNVLNVISYSLLFVKFSVKPLNQIWTAWTRIPHSLLLPLCDIVLFKS